MPIDIDMIVKWATTAGTLGVLSMNVFMFVRGDIVSRATMDRIVEEISTRTLVRVEELCEQYRRASMDAIKSCQDSHTRGRI